MAHITLLHLTDLHFGWDRDSTTKAERQVVLDSLIEHLARLPKDWAPQVVCISGDIGWRGKPDDYALAKAWLTKLLNHLGLGVGSVVVCAGNHDADRDVTGRMSRPNNAREADEILRAPIALHNLNAFAAFTHFCQDFGIAPYTFQGAPTYLLGHTVLHGVRFVACNSSWFCKDNSDKGNLWLGLPLIRVIEADGGLKASGTEPTVCLIHHPPDWWNEAETAAASGRPNTRDYLSHRADVILTGHTHGEVRKADRIAQSALHLTGGAGYSGSEHYNSYRLIQISKRSLQWRSFEYDPRSAEGAWRDHGVHTISFAEGPPDSAQVAQDPNLLAEDIARLVTLSREPMEDVITAIAGLPSIDRQPLVERVKTHLADHGMCLVVGESGSGKSALAKNLGTAKYDRVIWLTAENLHAPDAERLREKLGLHRPLAEVLASALGTCLVVVDGAERCSDGALRQVFRLIQAVRGDAEGGGVRFLVTFQLEAARRIVSRLIDEGLARDAAELVEVERPDEEAVGTLLASVTTLSWAALRPELRALLTNLKLLDWVVRAASSGLEFSERQPVTLTALVDRLWARWVEADGSAYGRSGLLMKLGELEASTLASGVPRRSLQYEEQEALASLVTADLVKVRNERVCFAHDLLGDWSRLRLFVGEEPTASADDLKRAASPRWHRAVRLFGQRLLEQGGNGPETWREAIIRADNGSETGRVVSDLLLEAIFFAGNARRLLEQAWPMLAADRGRLLDRLLDRFLYVATVPNKRLEEVFNSPEEAARFEHLFRLPFGPYWGAMLEALETHMDEVAELCPHAGAQVARLWLRSMPFPWRREAARLALCIARRYRQNLEAGEFCSKDEDQVAYEAALFAAPDLPDEVTNFCRRMAERLPRQQRSPRDDEERNEAATREVERIDPKRAEFIRQMTTPIFPLGPLRDPWPDGPLSRVKESFQRACLESGAFLTFHRVRPKAAVEVLLAVSIKEPQHEDPFGSSLNDDCGVESWLGGYPPLYLRGPFLAMLRADHRTALAYILKLVNFATQRFVETEPIPDIELIPKELEPDVWVELNGEYRRWLGDNRVFCWHHDWPIGSQIVTCSLMALEFWLYEALENGRDVSGSISRILAESESLAFAGLLLDVGKKHPDLFTGPLRPLLACAALYHLDIGAGVQRQGRNAGLIAWGMQQSEELVAKAREWYGQPHRRRSLRYIVQYLLCVNVDLEAFFVEVRAAWRSEMGRIERHPLRYLIEQLNPDNFVCEQVDDQHVKVSVRLPEALQKESEEEASLQAERMLVMTTPIQCSMRLEKKLALGDDELETFWAMLQRLDKMSRSLPEGDVQLADHINGTLGGVAVLLVLHRDWLSADRERLAWCRHKLTEVCQSPPSPSPFDSEMATGGYSWDSFAAEAGVVLFTEDPTDSLARCLVANGAMAYRYATVTRTISRAASLRSRLGGDFPRLVSLGVRYAAVRAVLGWRASARIEPGEWRHRTEELFLAFMDGTLSMELPSLDEQNSEACRGIEEVRLASEREWAERVGEVASGSASKPDSEPPGALRDRPVFFDTSQLTSTLTPLAPSTTAPEGEWVSWATLLEEIERLVLLAIPRPSGRRRGEAGLPTDFDGWLFSQIAGTLPRVPREQARRLWQPILDLGVSAHNWVERFYSNWFIEGYQNAVTAEDFSTVWEEMIRYAVGHPAWMPGSGFYSYDLSSMVAELLGFHHGMWTVAKDVAYVTALGRLTPVFEVAGTEWFGMAEVVKGFARFAVAPAAAQLLLSAIRWLSKTSEGVPKESSEQDPDDALINLLHEAWERHRSELARDVMLMEAFQGMLTQLSSRGSHAALALRDRVLKSLSNQGDRPG